MCKTDTVTKSLGLTSKICGGTIRHGEFYATAQSFQSTICLGQITNGIYGCATLKTDVEIISVENNSIISIHRSNCSNSLTTVISMDQLTNDVLDNKDNDGYHQSTHSWSFDRSKYPIDSVALSNRNNGGV